jgi:predicted MFS family arabinose efflux permease
MQAPIRLLRVARMGTAPGLLVSTAVATAVFIATPISLSAIADRFDVGPGTAGVFSAAQLGLFVVASWASGRFLTPSRRVFRLALIGLAVANLASVVTNVFVAFVAIRALSGLALGVLTWLAWSQVFGDEQRQGDIAVVGPLAGVVVSPLFGVLLEAGGDRAVFGTLAVAALVPLAMTPTFAVTPADQRGVRSRAVPQAMVLIAALALLTLGGSAVFVFGGVILIDELGVSPTTVSFVYSANALASIPSARWRGRRPLAGLWMVVTAVCAVLLGLIGEPWMMWPVLTLWGFAFWAGVPGIYTLLADRSARPAERAGDAQAAMAAGRALGPLLGGALVSTWSFGGLGVVGGALMATAGLSCVAVERYRPKK